MNTVDFVIIHNRVIVNSLGLLFGIVGSFLIWRFGLPASIDRKGAIHLIAEQADEKEVAEAKKYDCRSRMGFLLLIASFTFQLLSNFL